MTTLKSNLNSSERNISTKNSPVLEIRNLKKYFPVEHGFIDRILSPKQEYVHAIDDISFSIAHGEIFCLVGESGCGKTTAARIAVGLEDPSSGEFYWKGKKITHSELKPKKNDIKSQIIFQNPFSSLNPRMRLGDTVLHPLIIHKRISDPKTRNSMRKSLLGEISILLACFLSFFLYLVALMNSDGIDDILNSGKMPGQFFISSIIIFVLGLALYINYSWIQRSKVSDQTVLGLFDEIGLSPPQQYYSKYPQQVSGGERQRVAIARAIVLNPELLIADEPTSMLDVSLRGSILDLLEKIRDKFGISILFITHDLATARHFGDRIGVMYVGKLVEKGEIDDIFNRPLHPYTKALIDAIPTPIPGEKHYDLPKGEVADAIHPPPGCRFHPRCHIHEHYKEQIRDILQEFEDKIIGPLIEDPEFAFEELPGLINRKRLQRIHNNIHHPNLEQIRDVLQEPEDEIVEQLRKDPEFDIEKLSDILGKEKLERSLKDIQNLNTEQIRDVLQEYVDEVIDQLIYNPEFNIEELPSLTDKQKFEETHKLLTICVNEEPELREISPEHQVACHFPLVVK